MKSSLIQITRHPLQNASTLQAFEAAKADIARLGEVELTTPNVDVVAAARNLIAMSHNLVPFLSKLDAFAATGLDIDAIRKLEQRALALCYAHAVCTWELSGDVADATRERNAIWMLVLQSYRAAQRWIEYVRFDQGDADKLVRSPWQTKKRRASK